MSINKPRPILRWMLQLSRAAACLETLGYSHGDINPQNILFGEDDELRLIDFDHSPKVGDELDIGYEPYVRQHRKLMGGIYGVAGPVTEQFALGSVFWYMTRGSELYSELEGPDQVDRLLDGIFPATDPQDPIDRVIRNCWSGYYPSIADLVGNIQGISGSNIQTRTTENLSLTLERRLLCEQYCKRANLAPLGSNLSREKLGDESLAATQGTSSSTRNFLSLLTPLIPLKWRQKSSI
ncbi:hypothetical protein V2A60_002379 [Cordyceps javanica]